MASYSYEIGTLFTGTGLAATTAVSKDVVGSAGSSFDTEFVSGYLITVAGETRVVDVVTDADELSVTQAFTVGSDGAKAFTGANLVNVESLATTALPPPKSAFAEHSQTITLGDGAVRGLGWATGEWRWGFLSRAQRDKLRTFCTGASATVYVRTRKNDTADAYDYYSAVLVWPTGQEDKQAGKRLDFVAQFQNVTLIATA